MRYLMILLGCLFVLCACPKEQPAQSDAQPVLDAHVSDTAQHVEIDAGAQLDRVIMPADAAGAPAVDGSEQ